MEQLEAAGILGPDRGRSQGREVYLQTAEDSEPENGAGESRPSITSMSPPLAPDDATVDNEQAELPPPEDDDVPAPHLDVTIPSIHFRRTSNEPAFAPDATRMGI